MGRRGVLILSDVHLGAGPGAGGFDLFTDDDALAGLLRHYAEDRTYEELELIIAGDFFDSIQVPVGGRLPTRVYERDAIAKIRAIVAGHPTVFTALGRFARAPGRCVTFIAGNHDPATAFPGVRRELEAALRAPASFALHTVVRGELTVRHGNEWDLANRFETPEILDEDEDGPFIRFPWGSRLVVEFVSRVRERVPDIDSVKPLGAFIRWALVHRPLDAVVVVGWFLQFVLRTRFHRRVDERVSFARLLSILRGTCYSCDMLREAARFFDRCGPGVLVIGHTHRALHTEIAEGSVYVNTGTWTPVLLFRDGRFEPERRRTYALVSWTAARSWPEVALLEWLGDAGARPYEPSFVDTHLHPPNGTARALLVIASAAGAAVAVAMAAGVRGWSWTLVASALTAFASFVLLRRTTD